MPGGLRRRGGRRRACGNAFPQKGLLKFLDGLETVLGLYRHGLQQGPLLICPDLYPQLRGRHQGILCQPVQRLGRHLPGDDAVNAGGHRVQIGPGPLDPLAAVLLLGGKARFENYRHAAPLGTDRLARRSEIDQDHLTVLLDKNVVRTDVPVQNVDRMDLLQSIQHGHGDRHGFLVGQPVTLFGHVILQIHPLQVAHDDIGGSVGPEKITDRNDVGMFIELGQGTRFLQEFVQAVLELPAGAGIGRNLLVAHRPGGQVLGQIFLDRQLEVEV